MRGHHASPTAVPESRLPRPSGVDSQIMQVRNRPTTVYKLSTWLSVPGKDKVTSDDHEHVTLSSYHRPVHSYGGAEI